MRKGQKVVKPHKKKTVIQCMRMTKQQQETLRYYASQIEATTGVAVSVAWVMQTLMGLGHQRFVKKYIP